MHDVVLVDELVKNHSHGYWSQFSMEYIETCSYNIICLVRLIILIYVAKSTCFNYLLQYKMFWPKVNQKHWSPCFVSPSIEQVFLTEDAYAFYPARNFFYNISI